ncbi:alpha/beta fold hydrolase [Maritimibacter sp. HL-12]|uniref:alpha/beta fold hydrolase n=1 Tax=Maritimibacter sp. HL-12 TaxID=1162418 RepID=UPI000A0EFCA8|nr:alpha/beta hydrolase [Maritimibacter sp. HL-12]SMH50813.1 Pimeloyl-ACP methyl ester carboxylesterase [Maritimibacter sp. HL-12]
MSAPQYFTSEDGLRLAFRDEGAGLPLIALAGLTRNGDDFNFVAPHLPGVRLIRPDYRGRGRSQWGDPARYTIEQEARDVLGLMDHLGLARAAILGTSRGGLIAMLMAATAKERLLGVCLNDIGPEIAPEGLAAIAAYIGRNPGADSFEAAAEARARTAVGFTDVPPERWLADVKNLFTETGAGLAITYDPALARGFAEGAEIPPLWPLFDALDGLPIALIHGAGSDILAQATADEMRRRRPDMAYARLDDRGHVPWLDEPEALAAIHAWLADIAAATQPGNPA